MLDLAKLRSAHEAGRPEKKQVKTYLTPSAHARLAAASKTSGVPQNEILEALILQFLPFTEARKLK